MFNPGPGLPGRKSPTGGGTPNNGGDGSGTIDKEDGYKPGKESKKSPRGKAKPRPKTKPRKPQGPAGEGGSEEEPQIGHGVVDTSVQASHGTPVAQPLIDFFKEFQLSQAPVQTRRFGGDFDPSEDLLVGENGPELIPGGSNTVVPLNPADALPGSGPFDVRGPAGNAGRPGGSAQMFKPDGTGEVSSGSRFIHSFKPQHRNESFSPNKDARFL